MSQIGRLLYVSGVYLDESHGCVEHVWQIADHLAHLGWGVTLIGLVRGESNISDKQGNASERLTVIPIQARQRGGGLPAFSLLRAVARLTQQHDFDLGYIRPARKTLFATWWLYRIDVPYFVEVNTDTRGEYRALGFNRLAVALADWMERRQFSHARGAFCVTRELGEYVRKRLPADAKVWITGNGFRSEETDLAIFDEEPRSALGISREKTVITFLGSLQPWHGVDLLMKALAYLPDTYLWIIGNGPERSRLEALAMSLDIENRVFWFGYRHGVELQSLLNASDIGTGSFALHRNGMYEAQPLKVRHYLGVGLPTIIGYKDTLLDQETPGVFYAQSPEDIAERIQEIQKQGNARSVEYRQQIRDFALQHLSWAAIARSTSSILTDWLDLTRQERR